MSKPSFYREIRIIDDAIRTGKLTKQVLALIKDSSYNDYFFANINEIEWFSVLKTEKYFSPKNAPGPKAADKEGYYSIPGWNVLPYLEKVSEQSNLPGNEKYIDELLKIIHDVSVASGEHIDNFHTWRSFVLILINIPREKIPIDIIRLIPVWLSSKFDTSLVGSEIGLKLLPKFMAGDPSPEDISIAELIVEYITNVKAVELSEERARLFSNEKEYKLIIDSHWLKKIFEAQGKDIGEKCTNNVIYKLKERIRSVLRKDISIIPVDKDDRTYLLALSVINGKYLIRLYEMDEKSASNIYEYVLMKNKVQEEPVKEIVMDETAFENFSTIVFNELVKEAPFIDVDKAELKRNILRLYNNFYDAATYASLYDESRIHLTGPIDVFTYALKRTLLARATKHIDKTKEILASFFEDRYPYFPKMALYVIGNNPNAYIDEFFVALESDKSNLIFGEIYFGDELKHVLEGLLGLSSPQKEKLRTKIEQGPGYVPKEEPEMYVAKWKQKRYRALSKYPEFHESYDSLKSKTGVDVRLRPAVGTIEVRHVENPSPLSKEDILKLLDEKKLSSYLKDFRSKDDWGDGPTVGGLARSIKGCSTEHPNKFIDNLFLFIDSGFVYVYQILDGISDAWKNKHDIDWEKLFEFVYEYIDRQPFWQDKFIVEKDGFLGEATHRQIIGVIADLIREGTRDDEWAFDEQHLIKAEQILFLILDNLEVEKEVVMSDYVTLALNSSHGRALAALINLTLRKARINDRKGIKEEPKWSEKIKGKFNELLEKEVIESYILLGRYLPNLFYLDKEWAEETVKGLCCKLVDGKWEAFMDGYLSIGTVYSDLYKLITPHYELGILHDFKEKRDNEHLVQHIALGYLLDFEQNALDDPGSLLRKVLEHWETSQIIDIVSFFSQQERYLEGDSAEDKKCVDRIISFWRWVYENKYADKTLEDINDDDKKILSAFARLTIFIPSLNEEYAQWLLRVAPFANEDYNAYLFVEYLDKFDDPVSMRHVGKIFLKMLEHFITDFERDHIRSIVDKLYSNDQKDDADIICNTYGMNGYHFLRDLYETNNR